MERKYADEDDYVCLKFLKIKDPVLASLVDLTSCHRGMLRMFTTRLSLLSLLACGVNGKEQKQCGCYKQLL